ncbi:MAG: NADase-type glycan-binding domain-containing protein [Flavobacteriales bacterium]
MATIVLMISCGGNKNNNPAAENTAPTPAAESPISEPVPAAAQPEATLPVVKAKADSKRIMEWGAKPEEQTEGPTDPWVYPDWNCDGPSADGLKASSTLAPQGKFSYPVKNITDDNPTTAWVEGQADYGIGEFIELTEFSTAPHEVVSILNGYQASRASWENNSRVKQLKFSLNGKDYFILELADVMGAQTFSLPDDFMAKLDPASGKKSRIRLTIMDVYPGLKWKDTAITEIYQCAVF